ncbi:MAG: cytochrome c biogenesis protein [Cyanobacteria bacterium P01_F01_bin.42]
MLIFLRQSFRQQIVPRLANLRLAIALLLIIAAFSVLGTVVEQEQPLAFYQANYPESPALFGFVTWRLIQLIGLDHVYKTWWFLSLLVLFGMSLTACTFTTQLPALTTAQKWKYYRKPRQFEKLALSTKFKASGLDDLEHALRRRRYETFRENQALYARKGLVGKIGPIVVHISLIFILLSGIVGALTGFMAQEMVPNGETLTLQHVVRAGPFSQYRRPKDWSIKVNRFWIDYTPDGSIDQFYSDLSVINQSGQELDRETIHVNKPLTHKGVTFYQTDWAIAAVQVRINNSPVFQIPMAPLNESTGRIWGTWVPIKPDMSKGVTLLARDLQGGLTVYDADGKMVTTVRTGIPVEVEGITLTVNDIIGSTGLQIKADPGIPFLYLGCGLLIAGVVMSYISHSQVWALVDRDYVLVGGRTNRAQIGFEQELIAILEDSTAELIVESDAQAAISP